MVYNYETPFPPKSTMARRRKMSCKWKMAIGLGFANAGQRA